MPGGYESHTPMPGGYESHTPILAAALARTSGAILELGCGDGSTPMIHYAAWGRRIVSADTDEKWIARFAGYSSMLHTFHIVRPVGDDALPKVTREIEGWRKWDGPEFHDWGVAFIDCAPGEARHELAIRVADRSSIVICHDSETDYAAGGNYMYDRAKSHFKYVTEFRRYRPYTLVMSNAEPFEIEPCDRTWEPVT